MISHQNHPSLEDFITYDGKCAVCVHRMRGDFCIKKLKQVERTDTCELFTMGSTR